MNMKIVQIRNIFGPIGASCFSDCVATCANNMGEDYQLTYMGALVIGLCDNLEEEKRSICDRLVFSNMGLSNLLYYHGVHLIEKKSYSELIADTSRGNISVVEMKASYCPWDKEFGQPQSGTHFLLCEGFNVGEFSCIDPFYNVCGKIDINSMRHGYSRHYRIEHSLIEKAQLSKAELISDLTKSVRSFFNIQKEIDLCREVTSPDNMYSYVGLKQALLEFSHRTACYCIFLNYCDKTLKLFAENVDNLLNRLFKKSLSWVRIYERVLSADKSNSNISLYSLYAQIKEQLTEETTILQQICEVI